MNEFLKIEMVPKAYFDTDVIHIGDILEIKRVSIITYDMQGNEIKFYDIEERAKVFEVSENDIGLQVAFGRIWITAEKVENGEWEFHKQ